MLWRFIMKAVCKYGMLLIALIITISIGVALADNVLTLPTSLQIIDDEAFYGSTSIDKVILPVGVKEIHTRAFASSSITEVNLPDSLELIAEDAFEGTGDVIMIANPGTYAYNWAISHHYISPGFAFVVDEDGTITDYTGSPSEDMVIPNEIDGVKIKAIGKNVFSDCNSLVSISIAEGITVIGDQAFSGCENLITVNLPNGLTSIGGRAFEDCISMESIYLPDSITTLYSEVFDGCINLSLVNYPKSWTRKEAYCASGNGPFTNCPKLTTISIPDGVTIIPDDAFVYTTSIKQVILPSTINVIGENAFGLCTQLESISIPVGVTEIKHQVFSGCTKLNNVSLPDGLISIGGHAFEDCESLMKIHLPDSITTLYSEAFDGCKNLRDVNFPKSWTKKEKFNASGNGPFTNCPKLNSIEIPEGVTTIPDNAFVYTTSLTYVGLPSTLTRIGNNAFYLCPQLTQLYMMILPDGLISIGNRAFSGCGLSTVYLPSSLEYISSDAFGNSEITFHCYLNSYALEWCGNNDKNFIIQEFDFYDPEDYPVDPLLKLNWYSFAHKEGTGFAEVGGYKDCDTMMDVVIPSHYWDYVSGFDYPGYFTVDRIKSYAFQNKRNIRSVYVPNTVTQINTRAFYWCYDLVAIYIPDSVTSIGNEAFDGIDKDRFTVYGSKNSYTDNWCNENGFRFIPYNSTNDETEDKELICVGGVVNNEVGIGLPNVSVVLANENDEIIGFTYTGKDGKWSIEGLTSNQYAKIYYSLNGYSITGNGDVIILSENAIVAIAILDSLESDNISFSMKQNDSTISSIVVGTTVSFDVYAPRAERIRLVVDGVAYEQYWINDNGNVVFDRRFTQSGIRSVQIQAYNDGLWDEISNKQMLNVISEGTLEIPNIHEIGMHYLNNELLVSWDIVENADSYKVYLYSDYVELWSQDTNGARDITIPEVFFTISKSYSVEVIAYGVGNNQSTASTIFYVENPNPVTITYPLDGGEYFVGETMHTYIDANSGITNIRIFAVSLDDCNDKQWLKPNENGVFEPIANTTGQYEITPYYSLSNDEFDINSINVLMGKTVTVSVRKPKLDITERGNSLYSYYSDSENISADFKISAEGLSSIVVSLNGIKKDTITIDNSTTMIDWTSDSLNEEGLYQFVFEVYKLGKLYDTINYNVYIYSSVDPSVMYCSTNCNLYGIPTKYTKCKLSCGSRFTVMGLWANSFAFGFTDDGKEGFISFDNLYSASPTDTSNRIVSVSSDHSPWLALGESIQYEVIVSEPIAQVYALISTPNGTEKIYGEQSKDNILSYHIIIKPSIATIYEVTFCAENSDTSPVSSYCMMTDLVVYDGTDSNTGKRVYSKEKSIEMSDLSTGATIQGIVFPDFHLTILGTVSCNDDIFYCYNIQSGRVNCFGALSKAEHETLLTLTSTDTSIKRAYILASSHVYEQRPQRTSLTIDLAVKMFESMPTNFDIMNVNRCLTYEGLKSLMQSIVEQTDYNDVTYIYILAHGSEPTNGSYGFVMQNEANESGTVLYEDIVKKSFSKIHGELVLLLNPCMSGSIIPVAEKYMDKSRTYIITSCDADENSSMELGEPTNFVQDLYYLLSNGIITDQGLTLQEIQDYIPKRKSTFFLYSNTEHTQIFGNTNNRIIFSK